MEYSGGVLGLMHEGSSTEAAKAIYVLRDGEYLGPFTSRELRRHWANGVVFPEDLVWQEGMTEWVGLRQYFGIPSALASQAIPGSGPTSGTARLRAEMAVAAAAAGEPAAEVFEYRGHPDSRSGWISFVCWSVFGLSLLGSAVFYQRIDAVLLLGAMAVVAALLHAVRFRDRTSVGLVLASLLLPALIWWLAQSLLPPPQPPVQDIAVEEPPGSVRVEPVPPGAPES